MRVRFSVLTLLGCILGSLSSVASAALVLTVTSAPAPTVADFTTFTFNLANDTDPVNALEATFGGTGSTINQVFPNISPFTDTDPFFLGVPEEPGDDSHFLFNTTTDAVTGEPSILQIDIVDSDSELGGAISLFEPFTDRDVAQVVIPNGDIGVTPFSLKAVVDGQDFSFSGLIQDQVLVAVPEPSAFLAVGGLGCLLGVQRRRKRLRLRERGSQNAT